jgi:hypothetical protein
MGMLAKVPQVVIGVTEAVVQVEKPMHSFQELVFFRIFQVHRSNMVAEEMETTM